MSSLIKNFLVEKVNKIQKMSNRKTKKIIKKDKSLSFGRKEINPDFEKSIGKKNLKKIPSNMSKKDLTRFVKWPAYMKIQRQRQLLYKKLKIPPVINSFIRLPDKKLTKKVMDTFFPGGKFLENLSEASSLGWIDNPNPKVILKSIPKEVSDTSKFKICEKYIQTGLRKVVNSIRKGKALFVIISYDVNPIEIIIWLPFLCKKYKIPFSIISNKKMLGSKFGLLQSSCAVILKYHQNPFLGDTEDIFKWFGLNLKNN